MTLRWAALAAIPLLALLCYANALDGSFHFDDEHAVIGNPAIRRLGNPLRFFTDPTTFTTLPQNENYRPLLLVTYALTAEFTGVRARPFIAVNLAIHALCALLVALLVDQTRRLLGRPSPPGGLATAALIAGAIFAVHPLFSECVNYIHSRSESLAALLALISANCYLRGRDGKIGWLVASGVTLFLALCSKVVPGMLPFILVVFELAVARDRRSLGRRLIFLFVPLGLFTLLYLRYTSSLSVAARSDYDRLTYFRSELPAIFHYLRLFLWPAGQSADADYPVQASFTTPIVMVSALALTALVAFAGWALWRRRWLGPALAIVWFLGFLAPTSTVFPLAEIVNEHRPYLAGVALCALTGELLASFRAGIPLSLPLLIALGFTTRARNRTWHDPLTLWKDVVDKAPQSARAQMNYGLVLMGMGDLAGSGPPLQRAVQLAPNYPYAHINLGQWLLAKGETKAALAELDWGLHYATDLVFTYYYRGLASERVGEPHQVAAQYFAKAVQLSPRHVDSQYHLAWQLGEVGQFAAALEPARRAVELRGNYDDRFLYAWVLLSAGQVKESMPLLQQLARERPGDAAVQRNLEVGRRWLAAHP